MNNAPKILCLSIRGSIGSKFVFGHNLYGPWIAPYTWTPAKMQGSGMMNAFYVSELAAIWSNMTQEAKNSWKDQAKRYRITNYMAYLKVNILRLIHGRESIQTFEGVY